MELTLILILLAALLLAGAIWGGNVPKHYSSRICTGKDWRRAYPESPKQEIRRFLLLFVEAFAFKDAHKLRFQPDDRILDIYTATVGKWGVDSLELETLADSVQKEYGLNLSLVWRENLTLGELFSLVANAQQGTQIPTPQSGAV